MSYHQPTLSIVTQGLDSKLASIHRDFTDVFKQYRSYQGRGDAWVEQVSYYRRRLNSLSYRRRAYLRAIAILTKEEANS